MNIFEIISEIRARPEVTKAEAFAAGATIVERGECGDADALAMMQEIIGFVTQCDEPEFWRRFVVYELEKGPISKGGAL